MKKDIKKLVVKSNSLVEAKYKLTVREQKIILFLISQIKKEDSDFKTYTLPIKKFSEMMGLKGYPKYTEIRDITDNLQKKLLKLNIERKIYSVSWLSLVVYNQDEGTIDFRFDPFLKPFLLQLRREFTTYHIQNIISLNGGYSIRLYELLKQYESVKERVFELDDLRELLGVSDMYPRYSNFKQRILNFAQQELKDKTDISFEFEEIKDGRKVDKIKFFINKQHLDFDEGEDVINDSVNPDISSLYERINEITSKKKYTVDRKTVQKWNSVAREKWGNHKGQSNLLFLINEVNQKIKIKNPVGYITSVLASDQKGIKIMNQIKPTRKELVPEWLKSNEYAPSTSSTTVDEVTEIEFQKLLEKYKKH